MKKNKYKEGFELGLMQIQLKDKKAIIKELWEAIGCNNRNTFSTYKLGRQEPKAIQAARIEEVFHKYGINEIWGKYED